MLHTIPLMHLFSTVQRIEGRNKVQKMVYILQRMGFPFSERYRYHLHGPYSQELTYEIAHLVDLELIKEESKLEEGGFKRFRYETTEELAEALKDLSPDLPDAKSEAQFQAAVDELNAKSSKFLEAVATALFLMRSGMSRTEIAAELRERKPHLDQLIEPAVAYIENLERRSWLRP